LAADLRASSMAVATGLSLALVGLIDPVGEVGCVFGA